MEANEFHDRAKVTLEWEKRWNETEGRRVNTSVIVRLNTNLEEPVVV